VGDFEAILLGMVESSVQYHSVQGHILTCPLKADGDSIWWVV